jgi:hypothetical protein
MLKQRVTAVARRLSGVRRPIPPARAFVRYVLIGLDGELERESVHRGASMDSPAVFSWAKGKPRPKAGRELDGARIVTVEVRTTRGPGQVEAAPRGATIGEAADAELEVRLHAAERELAALKRAKKRTKP